MFDQILFPGVIQENWQMMVWERIGLTGLLSRIRPKGAIEVGVYYGGSLSLTSQYAEKIIAIDIDPAVKERFEQPKNAEIWIRPSTEAIPQAFAHFEALGIPVNFVLIDADHSAEGVRRDLELVLQYVPKEPMFVVMHDSGNPETRRGILSVDWAKNPYLHFVDCDFVPGQIIEHAVTANKGEVWGGLGIAYLDPNPRRAAPEVRQSARTSIRCLHHCAPDLSILR